MYSLRIVSAQNTESNEFIGAKYSFVHKDFSPIEFEKLWDGNGDVYAYLCYNGQEVPLFIDERNYIISPNGALYCNLTYKKRPSVGIDVSDGNAISCKGIIDSGSILHSGSIDFEHKTKLL